MKGKLDVVTVKPWLKPPSEMILRVEKETIGFDLPFLVTGSKSISKDAGAARKIALSKSYMGRIIIESMLHAY